MLITWLLKKKKLPVRGGGSALIIAGIFIAVAGMILLVQPYYTYAQDVAEVNFWLQQEWVEANPPLGEPGSLYDQLILVIQCRGRTIYNGPMSGMVGPFNFSGLIGPIYIGQTITIKFSVYLPGAETGNEFQGSHLETKYRLISELIDPERTRISFKHVLDPETALFDLRNLNPGDSYTAEMRVTFFNTTTPPTTGESTTIAFTLLGFLMILAGLILKKLSRDREENHDGA